MPSDPNSSANPRVSADILRIRLKIGDYEFEGEGPAAVVQDELAQFRKLLPDHGAAQSTEADSSESVDVSRVMSVDGRMVVLTTRRESLEEAILLLLLGQRELRGNNRVSGGELMGGLRASHYGAPRIDQRLRQLIVDGSVNAVGRRRARRYALTNRGLQKAQDLARLPVGPATTTGEV
jgi:hypothetical protein